MCAQKLSQMQLLVMPHGVAMHLDPKGLEVMPRNCAPNREANVILLRTLAASHRRTTERISKKPSVTEWVGESGGPPVKLRRSSSQRS